MPLSSVSLPAMLMVVMMLPFIFFALYEKDGQPAEKILGHVIKSMFLRNKVRPYRTNNLYAAVQLSKLKEFYEPDQSQTITLTQAFYHATKEAGSVFGKVGSFEKGYQISQMDELLERYGRFPGLYSRTLEDCVCMYVLKNVETSNVKERCSIYSNLVEEIRTEIIDGVGTDKEYQTDKFTEQLNIVSNVDELKDFVRENAKEFKRAYNRLYAYIKAFLYANNSDPYNGEVHFSINDLANKQGWSASLRKCVYAVNVGKWYPCV